MTPGQPGAMHMAGASPRCVPLQALAMRGDAAAYKENLLQQLIADSPWLLPVRDFLPATASIASLGREIAVDLGGQTGYIDNLLVTNEGRLVLVETKLWRNPESSREVIAQILQYGMALSALGLRDLESKVKFSPDHRTIADVVAGLSNAADRVDDLEDVIERHLRRGEMLYLIVSDGIRHSVERITHWLNDNGSAPFKFGLVELRFFDLGESRMLVVPRTLLRTREISRHVVVVDMQGPSRELATATVYDDTRNSSGAHMLTHRVVKPSGPAMTMERLVTELRARKGDIEATVAERVAQYLEDASLDIRSTLTTIQYGIVSPASDGSFYPLISLTAGGAWSHPSSELIKVIGDDEFVAHKRRMNEVGCLFYRVDQAIDPSKRSNELVVPFEKLNGRERLLAEAVSATAEIALHALSR